MRRRNVWLVIVVIAVICASVGIARALDGVGTSWQSAANPILTKTVDLPANIMPPATNFDCTELTVRVYRGSATEPDCMVTVPVGQVGAKGVVFQGTTEFVPVIPRWPFVGLQPIPNSGTMITYVSAPVVGNYLLFYSSIIDKLSGSPVQVDGGWQYNLTGDPEHSLRDASGKLVAANIGAMAFSSNGAWMVVDLPWQGFVRVNLRTFEIRPFAPSMQQNNDYSTRIAHLAISNDGLTVALKPNDYNQFKIYDLSSCGSASLPVAPGTDRCAVRDYFDYLGTQMPGLKGIYQPRFINNVQLSFSAVYNYAPGNYKAAKYTLTAPGESPTGMPYLGMGDSFASGEGAYEYIAGTDTANNACHLSSRNYQFLLKSRAFPGGNTVACSGAITDDIIDRSGQYRGQVKDKIIKDDRDESLLNSVKANFTPGYLAQSEFIDQYRPEVITLSIGGNDIGFADILKSCVSPVALPESCYPNYEDRLELANQISGVFDRLVTTYKTVLKPGKRVYAIGYPQITYPGGNCAVNVNLDNHELQLAADLVEYLNTVVERAAAKAGVRYVDVSNAFVGHRLCETISSDVAVNGFTSGKDNGVGPLKVIGNESYHPNAQGHALLEQAIRAKTNNLQQAMPAPDATAVSPGTSPALNNQGLPKSGRATNIVVADAKLAPQLLTRSQNVNVAFDTALAILKPLTVYKLVMHSSPVDLGTATSDAQGNLATSFQVPASLPPGFHTLHIYGPNLLGQPLDITRTVYVAASDTDYNGNAIPDTQEDCVLVASSGQDNDKDGVDDACDGYIAEPPAQITRTSNSVTLTNNTITFTR